MQLVLPKGKVTTMLSSYALFFLSSIGAIPKDNFFSYRMEITVNHQLYQVADICSIEQMLDIVLPLSKSGVAVAVNEVIITKNSWSSELIKSTDQVLIITATQGG